MTRKEKGTKRKRMRNRHQNFSLRPKILIFINIKEKIERKSESSNICSVSEITHLKCGDNRKTTSLRIRTWVLNYDINVLCVYHLVEKGKILFLNLEDECEHWKNVSKCVVAINIDKMVIQYHLVSAYFCSQDLSYLAPGDHHLFPGCL